jgi:hypothetical protein
MCVDNPPWRTAGTANKVVDAMKNWLPNLSHRLRTRRLGWAAMNFAHLPAS